MVCSLAGLVGLLLPGLSAPPLFGALLMLGAGASWGVYSLRGKRSTGDPTWVTGGNFLRAVPISLGLSLVMWSRAQMDGLGIGLAVASGAVASGIGYAIWYTAMRGLRATSAATIQLSVPVITALGGLLLLGETYSLRLLLAGAAILGGIALVVLCKRPSAA
jgi:drug/metabolite transporter (DMT)-like permease